MINQRMLVKKYIDNNVVKFNEELFVRSDDKIIDELKKVILSCQREYGFILRVESFTVIEDYQHVMDTLYSYEEMREFINSKKKNKELRPKNKKDNPYNFINIKDTDMKLLIVKYYVEVKGKAEYVDVIIAVPRIVDKYYFRISGNMYLSQYQIVDTTYNNATSSNIKHYRVTLRLARPVRIFKRVYKKGKDLLTLTTLDKVEIPIVYYVSKIFSKMFGVCKYFLGKYGLHETIDMMGFGRYLFVTDKPLDSTIYYVFHKYNIYINVVKEVYHADETLQSLVYDIHNSIYKDTEYNDIFSINYWLRSVGREFNVDNEEKGIQFLLSLEGIYTMKNKEILKIDDWYKQDVYHVLLYSIRNFSALMMKDNLNLAAKRVICEEYIAALYAAKLTTNLYRISNTGKKNKLTIERIKTVICTLPMYLISAITKCNLINYRDLVHDMDSMVVLSYSFKDASGTGTESMNSVQDIMRHVDISHTGRLDLDSSSKADPGLSAELLPTVKLYDGYFSDWKEPDTWSEEYNNTVNSYKNTVGLKEGLVFEEKAFGVDNSEKIQELDETISVMKSLMRPIYFCVNSSNIKDIVYSMEFSGTITIENDNGDDES